MSSKPMTFRIAPALLLVAASLFALPLAAQGPAEPAAGVDAGALPLVVVNKSPSCGCCAKWIDHLRAAGFPVEVRNTHALHAVKDALRVPASKRSCHTAEVAGYVVEGHVPAGDMKRLLAERPDARGLVLPGMPMGSPGMELPDGRVMPYTVELLEDDGSTRVFAEH